jgi:hypothetical protein
MAEIERTPRPVRADRTNAEHLLRPHEKISPEAQANGWRKANREVVADANAFLARYGF